jgi:hypothetical protein
MEINYRSKDESNKAQREAFLKLTGAERFYAFLALSERMSKFPVNRPDPERWSKNFQIVIDINGRTVEGEH